MSRKKVNEISVSPPVYGNCPICAVKHAKDDPHDPGSLYYRTKFHRSHGRYPTWEDAMEHCSATVKEKWRKRLGLESVDPD